MKRRLRGVWKEEFLTNEKYFIMHGYIYGTFNMWKEVFRDEKFFKYFKIFKFISTIDFFF